jgi:hypothetical protein
MNVTVKLQIGYYIILIDFIELGVKWGENPRIAWHN